MMREVMNKNAREPLTYLKGAICIYGAYKKRIIIWKMR